MVTQSSAGRRIRCAAVIVLSLLAGVAADPAAASPGGGHARDDGVWSGTWATVPTAVPPANVATFENQTIRQVVHVSIGGDPLRVRLSNEFGDRPLVIGAAHIARGAANGAPEQIAEGTDRRLTFGGRATVTVPPGAPLLSDPVALRVAPRSDVVVSVYLPERTEGRTIHAFAFRQNVVAAGNVVAETKVTPSSVIEQWYFLTGVSVRTRRPDAAAVVTLGDSITDGANTTMGADLRWPDILAGRLQANRDLRNLAVLNEGISGNRLLHDPNPPPGSDAEDFAAFFGESALRRFDRDVGAQPGAKYVIVLLGVNDLGHPGTVAPPSEEVSAAAIIGGYQQLIARAHERGLKIFGGTILPFRNDTFGFYTPEREATRQAVNAWIRTSGEYDAVIDFDAALRDPAHPGQLLPIYDSGDHLHPNDAGAAALANAVPLRIFR
ncbi:MAG TPA: SGNH/GDSL hydrolase family protein [Streptosporangiaceae bacterium]|jgi:lysophospholipase L1-like esterase